MYQNYIFDLYGTLVDINTNEWKMYLWEKLRIFYGYYGAHYTARELKNSYEHLVSFIRMLKKIIFKKILEPVLLIISF